jgi:hypothetical protein
MWLSAITGGNDEYRYRFESLYPDLPHSHVLRPRMHPHLFGLDRICSEDPMPDVKATRNLLAEAV